MLDARVDRLEAALTRLAEAQARTEQRLDQLAGRMDQLAEAQRETSATLAALAEAQRQTDVTVRQLVVRIDQLAEAQHQTDATVRQLVVRIDQLAEAQRQTDATVRQLAARMDELAEAQKRTAEQLAVLAVRVDRFDAMRGYILEARYREKAHAYFDDLLLRLRVVPGHELAALLDDAEERGLITRQQRRAVLDADVVARGRLRDTGVEAYLVAEVSAVIDPRDVHRAVERARVLERISGLPVVAAVGGEAIIPDADREAQAMGVHRVLDGRPGQ